MNNILDKLQTCVFMEDTSVLYLKNMKSRINDHTKMRKLFCEFEAPTKKSARKLCLALQQVGFEAYPDDFEQKMINAKKNVAYETAHYALNIAMYEAWKHGCSLVTLMIDQDIQSADQ